MSFEESARVARACRGAGLAYVDLVAPTSSDERVRAIARASEGFVYVVSLTGVTGRARRGGRRAARGSSRACGRDASAPVYVGFGVSTPEQAAESGAARRRGHHREPLVQHGGDGARERAGERVGDFVAGVRRGAGRQGETHGNAPGSATLARPAAGISSVAGAPIA